MMYWDKKDSDNIEAHSIKRQRTGKKPSTGPHLIEESQEKAAALMAGLIHDLQAQKMELKNRNEELLRIQSELEQRVKARTAQLSWANAQMESQAIELTAAKEQAEAHSIAKSKFLSKMSHELRTPLNPIMGYAQLLKQQNNLTAGQKEQLQVVCDSCARLTALIEDMLEMVRIDTCKDAVEPAVFNLQALTRAVVKDAQRKADQKNLTIHYEQKDPLPESVFSDSRMLYQALSHLLDNAVKFTDHGQVTLRTSVVQSPKPGTQEPASDKKRRLRFEVADTGFGIPSDITEDIFKPFYQGPIKGRVIDGTGLGLTLSRRMVELMGGRLSVQSPATQKGELNGGPGSVFTLELDL